MFGEAIFKGKSFPGTSGGMVRGSRHALTALSHLVQLGIKFPSKAAFIARDHDSFLEHVVPTVARYQTDPVLFAHKISRVSWKWLRVAMRGRATTGSFLT